MRDVTNSVKGWKGVLKISTHTSHAGRDTSGAQEAEYYYISTHTSHAGRDCPERLSYSG